LNVVFIAAECAPFAKVGGLADVVGALPQALAALGHQVRVIIPCHGIINTDQHGLELSAGFWMDWSGSTTRVDVLTVERGGVTHDFIRGWPYFSAEDSFVYAGDDGLNAGRFLFFCAAALEWLRQCAEENGAAPDLIHVHDWHTAPIPYLLFHRYQDDPFLGGVATLFSIHNMQYQGWGIGWHLERAGLPAVDHPLLTASGKADNALAVGLLYATMLSTVSPTYAQEITTYEGGNGLDGLTHARQSRLVGILNGIDTARWNPGTSRTLTETYTPQTLDNKRHNKLALQNALGLPLRSDVPLAAAVTRLVDQKGISIMVPAVRHMLYHAEMQFVLLGTGDPHWEHESRGIGFDYPQKAAIQIGFNEQLSEQIYAGADLFLMPSLFEPCGIGQMLAMRYGSLPVVRAVGGLLDTVDPTVGFLFKGYNRQELVQAISEGLDVFYNNPQQWRARQAAAMSRDFSWGTSARQYAELYHTTVEMHNKYA